MLSLSYVVTTSDKICGRPVRFANICRWLRGSILKYWLHGEGRTGSEKRGNREMERWIKLIREQTGGGRSGLEKLYWPRK